MRNTRSCFSQFRAAFLAVALLALFAVSLEAANRIIFTDFFTDGNDAGWQQIDRVWHVTGGRYVLDGGYKPGAQGRDGYAVTHVGDRSWRNYVLNATFDNTNAPGLPTPDVHNAEFLVRVQSLPLKGTFYRISVWPSGTTDPRKGYGVIPGGLVQIMKYVNGSVVQYIDREYSNSVAGTNSISITVTGSIIRVDINGKEVLIFSDSNPIRFGGIGLGAIWEAEAWFDNVIVGSAGAHLAPHDDEDDE